MLLNFRLRHSNKINIAAPALAGSAGPEVASVTLVGCPLDPFTAGLSLIFTFFS